MNDSDPLKANRNWHQFRVRALIGVVVLSLLVAGGAWLGVKVRQAARHQEAVRALEEAGWEVGYEHEVLGFRLGDVVYVGPAYDGPASSGPGYDLGDEDLEQFKALTGLRSIRLDGTRVTGPGLVHLKGLASLTELSLDGARVTEVGLKHIEGFTNLTFLNFSHMRVTDAELNRLKSLTNLEVLIVCCLYKGGRKISDEDFKELQEALPNCMVIGP